MSEADDQLPQDWAEGKKQMKQIVLAIFLGMILKFLGIFQGLAQAPLRHYFAWLLRIVGGIGMFIVNQTIEAQGLKEFGSDLMTTRLSRLPFLSLLGRYHETRYLELANIVAFALCIFTYIALEALVKRIVHRPEETYGERLILVVVSAVLLLGDTVAFVSGLYDRGSTRSLVIAIAVAIGYDCVLILFAWVIVRVERSKT